MSTETREVCCLATKKRRKEGSIMKKMLFILVALLIVTPAMAEDVVISASAGAAVDGNTSVVTISIDASASAVGIVRALALDITLVGEANIVDVNCVNADYEIYPGSIQIAGDGTVSDDGSCLCDASYAGTKPGLDTNEVTVEMGSLYVGEAPDDTAVVVEVTVVGCGPVELSIAENAIRGGIVMEDPDAEPTVLLTGASIADFDGCEALKCMKDTHPFYANWVAYGEPACWCYARQCKGDLDDKDQLGGAVNVFTDDLDIFLPAFGTLSTSLPGVCADINYDTQLGGAVNVFTDDLDIFLPNFGTKVTDCDATHYNFWEVAP